MKPLPLGEWMRTIAYGAGYYVLAAVGVFVTLYAASHLLVFSLDTFGWILRLIGL